MFHRGCIVVIFQCEIDDFVRQRGTVCVVYMVHDH